MDATQDTVTQEKKGGVENSKAGFYEYYQTTVSLIKAVVWPAVVIYFFISLRGPITATVEQFPNLFYKTTHITIAGVTLEVDQRLQASAPLKLREAISKLSPEALKELVRIGESTNYTNSSYPNFSQQEVWLKELKEAGLIELEIGISDPEHPNSNVKFRTTELGRKGYAFVVEVLVDQLIRSTQTDGKEPPKTSTPSK
jgi:hypothetical protein